MSDIVQRLRNWCTDWDRAPMARGEPPRDGLHCGDLLDAAAEIERLRAQFAAPADAKIREALSAFILKAMQGKVHSDDYGTSHALKINWDRARKSADEILAALARSEEKGHG